MSSKIDSNELGFVIGTVLGIGEGCVVIGSSGPCQGGQVDIPIDVGRVD